MCTKLEKIGKDCDWEKGMTQSRGGRQEELPHWGGRIERMRGQAVARKAESVFASLTLLAPCVL